jgi:hypothetical protein
MLPNVWSVEEFKSQSNKVFSSRSPQLQAIDRALLKAQSQNPMSDAGANAIMDLLQAIAEWRKLKLQQGKQSGRARAVDQLQSQLAVTAELIYKRKIGEQKALDVKMNAAKVGVAKDLQSVGLMQGKLKPPVPPRPMVPTPPVPPSRMNLPTRDAAQDRLFDFLAQAMIDQRRKAMGYDDEDLFDDLDVKQKGRLAARWMLSVPDEVKDVNAARAEALRILGAMLGNNVGTIKNLLENNLEVIVIPRDKGMTVLEQFKSLRGQITHDGRTWEPIRGVGNVTDRTFSGQISQHHELKQARDSGKGPGAIVAIDPKKGKVYTAITEENLLGGPTTAPGAGCYDTGYSTTSHEFAHSIHQYGLNSADRATIDRIYKMRLQQSEHEEWVDGPRKVGNQTCYAAQTVFEYFAQLSNAWLGVNIGNDPYTGKPRKNGKQWVLDHEPRAISEILDRVYGNRALEDLNPAVILKS